LHFDAEILQIIADVLRQINIPAYTIRINNRKILDGYLQGLGLTDNRFIALRILDKLDKISEKGVLDALQNQVGLDAATAQKALSIATISGQNAQTIVTQVQALGITHPNLSEGLEELAYVWGSLDGNLQKTALIDLSVVRGFDYYTGTVYETRLDDYPNFGAIVSGGRYADLAGSYINKKLPGVGISIGLTRLFSKLLTEGLLKPQRPYPTQVLVTVPTDAHRTQALNIASQLRAKGLNVEVFHQPQKMQKQLAYADKKQIPYVWFTPENADDSHQVKNMATGAQTTTTIDSFIC
jgi:histidyl-tRNA synthetase